MQMFNFLNDDRSSFQPFFIKIQYIGAVDPPGFNYLNDARGDRR
jgi:hypothetical protein